mgnify:CR=1 FL=1
MDDQRKLSDLTDLEIADLTQKLKANTSQPLVEIGRAHVELQSQ